MFTIFLIATILILTNIYLALSKTRKELSIALQTEKDGKVEREHLLLLLKLDLENLKAERTVRENFVITLSHDLRTPLATARMAAELILEEKPENLPEHFRLMIIKNIDRVEQMVADLLDANRIRVGQKIFLDLSHCDLSEIIKEVIAGFTLSNEDRFVIYCSAQIKGYWSSNGISRMLENLICNALNYGSEETKIVVSLAEYDDKVSFSVNNQGSILSKEELEKIFDPFHRGTNSGGKNGCGLGLTVVKGIAEAHGGTVAVTSLQNQGTTFKVEIPKDSRLFQSEHTTG